MESNSFVVNLRVTRPFPIYKEGSSYSTFHSQPLNFYNWKVKAKLLIIINRLTENKGLE